jgi:hypothetical protein
VFSTRNLGGSPRTVHVSTPQLPGEIGGLALDEAAAAGRTEFLSVDDETKYHARELATRTGAAPGAPRHCGAGRPSSLRCRAAGPGTRAGARVAAGLREVVGTFGGVVFRARTRRRERL